MDFQNINDVETLKQLLAAQQQQLQQLQGQGQQQQTVHTSKDPDFVEDFSDEEADAALDKDDDIYDPENDSDYDDAPKKRKSGSSKKQKGSGRKKQRRESWDDDSCSDSDADVRDNQQEKQQAQGSQAAGVALRSVKTAINQQMVYRPSLKYGRSRVSLELPCLTEAIVQAMLGPELLAKATNGKKQVQLKASNDDLGAMYGGWSPFGKSLRYGATLELIDGLTFTFNKTTGVLKVHGLFTMVK